MTKPKIIAICANVSQYEFDNMEKLKEVHRQRWWPGEPSELTVYLRLTKYHIDLNKQIQNGEVLSHRYKFRFNRREPVAKFRMLKRYLTHISKSW